MADFILHILDEAAWQAAQQSGREYQVASLESEGFIHFSTIGQMPRTARKHYAGRTDLRLLVVEVALLNARLAFEPPVRPVGSSAVSEAATEELFPHLYGPLNLDAVRAVLDFPINPDGTFTLPAEVAQYVG